MDDQLRLDVGQISERLEMELLEKLPRWVAAKSPAKFFDFEQELQVTLNALQSRIVGSVLEAIHRDTAFVSECKGQALHDLGMQNSGLREKRVRTLSGNQIRIRTPYLASSLESRGRIPDGRYRVEGSGRYPVLRKLGIVKGSTPRLLAEINRQMADGPSGAEAEERLVSREIKLYQTSLWYQVRDFASIALWQRQEAAAQLDQVDIIDPPPLAGKRVVVGIDGGRLRIRVNKTVSDQAMIKDYTADDCEPKLFVIYTVDNRGNKDNKGIFVYDGTLQSNRMLFSLLKLRLRQLGVDQAELLVITGDGAGWIWKGVQELRSFLHLEDIPVFEVVDFAHSAGKMMLAAKLGIRDPLQRIAWFKKACRLLKKGEIDEVIEGLCQLDRMNDEKGEISKTITYFQHHHTRIQYHLFRQHNLPIGSGVIESGVRRIINLRLRGASIYWSPSKAEQLIYLRCIIKSGQWNTFFKSVLSDWANDMSKSLFDVYEVNKKITHDFLVAHPPLSSDKSRTNVISWANNMINSGNAIILDTETTGLTENDEIIQLGIVDLQGKTLVHMLFKPTIQICDEASSVHGLRNIDLENCHTFADSYDVISDALNNKDIIAYNAEFDRRLLTQTCKRYGLLGFDNVRWHCVMEKYACYWGERRGKNGFKNYNLATACRHQDIQIEAAHQAVGDCLLTLELVKVMASGDE